VLLGENRFPAYAESGWIDDSAEVEVVGEEPFGVRVRVSARKL
jgi:hypothetical protein